MNDKPALRSTAARLGFGCANIAKLDRSAALALLETALDSGISHFDTAPLYGWGKAEGLLGEVAQRKRDDMTLVTKVGISQPSLAARVLGKMTSAAAQPRFGRFAPHQVRSSIETSLRELKTDRVDAVLLHEAGRTDVTDELARVLQDLVAEGKTAAIGLATKADVSSDLVKAYAGLFDLVQIDIGSAGRTPAPQSALLIVHSVLGERLARVQLRLAADADAQRRLEANAGVNLEEPGALGRLLLSAALAQNSAGVTLFSSANLENVRQNAALAAAGAALAADIASLLADF